MLRKCSQRGGRPLALRRSVQSRLVFQSDAPLVAANSLQTNGRQVDTVGAEGPITARAAVPGEMERLE
jgi:hypothetical protein